MKMKVPKSNDIAEWLNLYIFYRIDLIFIICFSLFSVIFFIYISSLTVPEYDSADYLLNARNWFSDKDLSSPIRPPLISWIIACVWSITGENWIIIKYLIPSFSLAAGLFLYLHLRKYKGGVFAFGVVALTLLNAHVFFWSTQILTEGLSLFFLVMTLWFIKSDNKNYWLLAGIMIGLTFASRYPIAIQAITIFIVESFIRKDIKLILRALAGAVPTIILVIFAVYLKTGTFSGAIPEDIQFSFPPSLFYISNWSDIWGYAFLFIPAAFLFKRTWKDKYNYTFIMWFLVALVFWSSNANNHQERFIVQFAPAVYFLVVLAIENIARIDISAKLGRTAISR
jgi:4-amino-4-deoxy-L-arabinose transferase-like glycosyltransferase